MKCETCESERFVVTRILEDGNPILICRKCIADLGPHHYLGRPT